MSNISFNEEEAYQQLKQHLDQLEQLTDSQKHRINDDIKNVMIPHYLMMTQNIDVRRASLSNYMYQYLTILGTAFGIIVALYDKMNIYVFVLLVELLVIQAISAILVLKLYHSQNSYAYPFKSNNQWKWFYYGNPEITKMNTKHPPSVNADDTTIPYFNGLLFFIDNYGKEDINSELKNNIQQLYLLQVHNYYKNQFDKQLTQLRLKSIKVTAAMLGLSIIIAIIVA